MILALGKGDDVDHGIPSFEISYYSIVDRKGVQIEAAQAIELCQVINVPVDDRVLWSLAGRSSRGVTMVVNGTVAELTALAHRLLDMLAELDEENS